MKANQTPDEQDVESILGQFSNADLISLIKRMLQRYPDLAGMIVMAPPADAFWLVIYLLRKIVDSLQLLTGGFL